VEKKRAQLAARPEHPQQHDIQQPQRATG